MLRSEPVAPREERSWVVLNFCSESRGWICVCGRHWGLEGEGPAKEVGRELWVGMGC